MEELMNQSIILREILYTLKLILREMKDDDVDIDEDFINSLFETLDKTADVVISFLELLIN